MKIAGLSFASSLIQAPLAGYSCAPFRRLAHQWGRPAFSCTEMLSAKHIYTGAKQRRRYIYKDPAEGLLCFQFSANEEQSLLRAADKAIEWGADLIDLNCGCPQPKIRKKQLGSSLLSHPDKLYQLIAALKSNTHLPVLVKIRVDHHSGDHYNRDVARAVEQAGADALTVHGRNWRDDYDTPVSYADIASIVDAISIPVIGNGDISDTVSAKKMRDQTGCAGLMIARASVGQPWLFAQITAELNGQPFTPPSFTEIGRIFLEHVRGLIDLDGEHLAVLQARKLSKYYARGRLPAAVLTHFYQMSDYHRCADLVAQYFH